MEFDQVEATDWVDDPSFQRYSQYQALVRRQSQRLRAIHNRKRYEQPQVGVKEVAINLLRLTERLGELELSQQDRAVHIYPELAPTRLADEFGMDLPNIFSGANWVVRSSEEFTEQACELSEYDMMGCLAAMKMLSDGFWPGPSNTNSIQVHWLQFEELPLYNGFFLWANSSKRPLRLLFNAGVERFPDRNEFKHQSYIKFWGVSSQPDYLEQPKEAEYKISDCWDKVKSDYALAGYQSTLEIRSTRKDSNVLFVGKKELEEDSLNTVLPIVFESTKNLRNLIFKKGILRWVKEEDIEHVEHQRRKIMAEQRKQRKAIEEVNLSLIRQVVEWKRVQELINILMEKIPGFKIRCSEEEKTVIAHSGNAIVMGRSGTGKTTCAVLRLFAVQTLFHIRQNLGKNAVQLMDSRNGAERAIGLHSVFTTASAYLAREVERYYRQYAFEIRKEIARKRGQPFNETNEAVNVDKLTIDIDQIKNSMFRFRSLEQLSENQYPAFLTTKEILFMIDGTLQRPFFNGRPKQGGEGQYANANQTVRINCIADKLPIFKQQKNEVKPSFSEQEDEHQKFRQKIELEESEFAESSFEMFCRQFWPQVRANSLCKNLNPEVIWSEIVSVIKGHNNSHQHPNYYLPEQVYVEVSENQHLPLKQRRQVYQTYLLYESWKVDARVYDIMDAVNYNLHWINKHGYTGPPIHYLMVDQVQDLPFAFIQLLTRVVEAGILFSGDSAQTIAKGVDFRFVDVRKMFDKRFLNSDNAIRLEPPQILQLTVNFRSHNAILQLSNSVVSIIELMFPFSIDRMRKERSDYDGPKPVLLSGKFALWGLARYMENAEDYNNYHAKMGGGDSKRSKLEFGFFKTILVRDTESKKNLPKELQDYMCMTVQQAKGLEFYDVLLYNFFHESKVPQHWKLLQELRVHSYRITREQFEEQLTKFSELEGNKSSEAHAGHLIEGDSVLMNKLCLVGEFKKEQMHNIKELCAQLKLLYTAITRARNNLWIYDETDDTRKPIEAIWKEMNVLGTRPQSSRSSSSEVPSCRETKEELRQQGMIMLARGILEQAIKFFRRSGDYQLFVTAEARLMADRANKSLSEAMAELGQLQNSILSAHLSKGEKKQRQKQMNEQKLSAMQTFRKAATKFAQIQEHADAGKCYFSAGEFEKALNSFSIVFKHKEMGLCHFKLGRFRQAAAFFLKSDASTECLEALDASEEYEVALGVVHHYQQSFESTDRIKLIEYFLKLSLDRQSQDCLAYHYSNRALNARNQRPIPAEQQLLLSELASKRIVLGKNAYRPNRIRQRAINLIALKSRHVVLEGFEEGYDSFKAMLFGDSQINDSTNDEVALSELQRYDQVVLCIELCRFYENLFERLPYYGISWAYKCITLPGAGCFGSTKSLSDARTKLAVCCDSASVLLDIVDSYAQEEQIPKAVLCYYVQGLILLGLYQRTVRFLDSKSTIQICFAYFDWRLLQQVLPSKVNDMKIFEKPFFESSKYGSLFIMLKIEQLLWARLDKNLKKPSPPSIAGGPLPAQINFGKVYDPNRDFSENSMKYLVRGCISSLSSVIKGDIKECWKVYDTVTFALYIVHSPGVSLLKDLKTTEFLQFYLGLKQLADSIVTGIKGPNGYKILEGILSFYRLRLTRREEHSHPLEFLGDESLFMHNTSPLAHQILQQNSGAIRAVEVNLQVLSVPLGNTLKLLQAKFLKRLRNCMKLFCSTPDQPPVLHKECVQLQFKQVLRHMFGMTQPSFLEKRYLGWLLLFDCKMPTMLRNHLINESTKISQRLHYPLRQFHECAMLLVSNSAGIYRELYPRRQRCDLYYLLNEPWEDLEQFNKYFWQFYKMRELPSLHKLPMIEKLLLILLEKYRLVESRSRHVRLTLFASQLVFFKQMEMNKDGSYRCLERYYLRAKIQKISARISEFFYWLQQELNLKDNQCDRSEFDRIKNLVFAYMINLDYRGSYGLSLRKKHIAILDSCGVNPPLIQQIQSKVEGALKKQASSSRSLVRLITENAETTYEVEFSNESDNNLNEAQRSIEQKINREKQAAAVLKIQRWWRNQKRRRLNTKEHQDDTVFDNQTLSKDFYRMRSCRQLLNETRDVVLLPPKHRKWSPGELQRSVMLLNKLAELRNQYSALSKVSLLVGYQKVGILYRSLEVLEEDIEQLLAAKKIIRQEVLRKAQFKTETVAWQNKKP